MENEVPSIVDKCTKATYDIPLVRVAVRAMDLHHPFDPRLRSTSAQRSSRRQSNFRCAPIRSAVVWRAGCGEQRNRLSD
jgi:hypothetical protein